MARGSPNFSVGVSVSLRISLSLVKGTCSYCEGNQCAGQTQKTRAIQSPSPTWNQSVNFVLDKAPDTLNLTILNNDDTKNPDGREVLGEIVVPVLDRFNTSVYPQEEDVQTVDGSVTLTVRLECRVIPQAIIRWLAGFGHDEVARLLKLSGANVNQEATSGRVSGCINRGREGAMGSECR